jgi:hypothetical protein
MNQQKWEGTSRYEYKQNSFYNLYFRRPHYILNALDQINMSLEPKYDDKLNYNHC